MIVYWVIGSERRSSWMEDVPEDNPLVAENGGI
jgi:putative ABC transport system permease protein